MMYCNMTGTFIHATVKLNGLAMDHVTQPSFSANKTILETNGT